MPLPREEYVEQAYFFRTLRERMQQSMSTQELLEAVKQELLHACRQALPAHKVPSLLRFVPSLELTAAGKLVRPSA